MHTHAFITSENIDLNHLSSFCNPHTPLSASKIYCFFREFHPYFLSDNQHIPKGVFSTLSVYHVNGFAYIRSTSLLNFIDVMNNLWISKCLSLRFMKKMRKRYLSILDQISLM